MKKRAGARTQNTKKNCVRFHTERQSDESGKERRPTERAKLTKNTLTKGVRSFSSKRDAVCEESSDRGKPKTMAMKGRCLKRSLTKTGYKLQPKREELLTPRSPRTLVTDRKRNDLFLRGEKDKRARLVVFNS